ncbi:DUF2797 domain-containing protein [Arthrobacter sp. UKPF54-2]|uniref:DUF2797 domain-containing protein n=1 Tax=Arthrobacter sp. UKPF54-2 TaxID=2600159 RepID=UPI0011B142D2|nr:DUF2797 domain-containing protein [Arthrobacter sp. UKPF54-2]QDY90324.1 DUF2797 domain-containing protein [Arthrobacter sp. UKPF54-2]
MTDARYLVHGVFWDGPPPAAGHDAGRAALRLQDPSGGFTEVALDAGTRLGFRLASPGKHCLGHHKVHGPADRDHLVCPDRAPAARGSQCGPCFAVDDSRLIHDFHRGGRVPSGLRSYLMQPHWLYIATFAHGASKVGTASQLRKWHRLAEQGAVVARYVARAGDGRVVRVLEDLVTSDAGLPQQVRSAAKAAGLTAPAAAAELDGLNGRLAAEVRTLLAGAGGEGFDVVDERWQRPGLADAACTPAARHAYPHDLGADAHGFTVSSLSGSIALAWLDGADLDFVVNLGALKGRVIELGDHGSEVPAVQESLF